jgi:peptidoglycan/xylan/chitin deacetylase (PgdA/CDA1 family)
MSGESGEPRSDPKALLGFLVVLAVVLGLLAWGVVRGQGDDGADATADRATTEASAAPSSPTALPEVEVTAPPPATPRRCRGGHVALTFDDGPSETTGEILDDLAAAGVRATFFNVGAREQADPDMVRRTAAEGHDFGNHSFDHSFLDELAPEDLQRNLLGTNQIHEQDTGQTLEWFRPPYGRINAEIRGTARGLGLRRVLWTNDARDWDPDRSVRDVVRQVARAEDGDVVLMHDDGYPATLKALPRILDRWAERGICSGRLVRTRELQRAWDGAGFFVTAGPWE